MFVVLQHMFVNDLRKLKFKKGKTLFCPLPCSKRKSIFVTDIFDIISTLWPHKQLLLKVSVYFCMHFCFPIMHYILKTLSFSLVKQV